MMMTTMRIRRLARAALLPALLAAACTPDRGTQPSIGGEYLGELDSPFSAEGAALIELTSPDVREISAPGRILVARGATERTTRILVVNPPNLLTGGPITFRVRMAEGAVPPVARVLQVSGPVNQVRDFVNGYQVNFRRVESGGGATYTPPRQTNPPSPPFPFARAVAPFFPDGAPLTPPEVTLVDGGAGNGNRVYDLGDLRGYLAQYPAEIPPQTSWTR
jgi:hypothetical protein